MKRRLLSMILAALMLVSLLPAAVFAAPAYNDTNGHWAADAIDRWSEYGVVSGKGGDAFDPNGPMRRSEAAQMFANLLGLNKEGDISEFTDVEDDWYTSALAKCYAAGIMTGKGEGKMDPNGLITREEFFTMFARAVCISNGGNAADVKSGLSDKGYTDTAKVSDWAADAIGTLVEKGYVGGVSASEIAPQAQINRASVMALLDQSISTYVGKDSTETTVAAKSEGITLIANPAVTTVTGTADVVIVAAGAEQFDADTGEIAHNDIRVESAKMPVARVQGENITVTLALSTTADDATVTETGVDSIIVIESTSEVKNAAVEAEGAKIIVKDGAKAETVTVAETAKSATVETAKNATVGTVTIAAESATATVAGKVETVKVEETAKNATIDTKSTAKVETVENKAENTAVTGEGSVGAVKSSEDVKVETKNTKVENTSETKDIAVTDSKGTETKVETKTEGTASTKPETTVNTQPTGGDGGGHSHSYTGYVAISDTQHKGTCSCGSAVTANHDANGEGGACSVCGYVDGSVAMIPGTTNQYFDTLAAAVSAAKTDETVVLLKDISAESSTALELSKIISIDFNDKTLTNYQLTVKAAVTFENGTIINNNETPVTLYGTKLTLDGVLISTTGADAFVITNESESATNSTIIVADGSTNAISTTKSGCDGIFAYAFSDIVLNIAGEANKTGKLTVSGENSSFHEYGASGNIYATVSGLEIEFANEIETGYGNTLEISDVVGIFSTDASDYCIAGYCTAFNETSGKYVYTEIDEETAVCRIIHSDSTYTYLMSLEQAMMQVSNEEIIQLLQNVAINNQTSDGINATKVIIDLNKKTITAKGTWLIAKHAGSYSYSPIEATIKNGNYVLNGTDSGRIRFEKGSTGHFEEVIFSTSNGKWYQALQTYATNTTGENEVNTYDFKNCTFTNCWTGFEGKSGSCNKYEISFTNCEFTAANMSTGAACIMIDDYDYGKLTVTNSTFNINNTNNGGYCVNVDTYLSYTNGQKFDLKLNGVTMNTTGNAQPYTYRFLNYNSEYSDNANITVEGTNTFTHNDKTVEMFIKESSATSKSVAWTENPEAYKACLAEWVAYANAKPSDYDQYKYYLVESNGYYYIGGQGTQFNDNATVTKESDTITKVVVAGYFTTTYNNIGTADISTQLGGADNANVHIYTLA